MSSSGGMDSYKNEAISLMRQIQSANFFNRQLSSICQVNGLKSTGVKAELQTRIVNLLQECINHNDVQRFMQVRHSIANATSQRPSPGKPTLSRGGSVIPTPQPQMRGTNGAPLRDYQDHGMRPGYGSVQNGYRPAHSAQARSGMIPFKESPFYEIRNSLGSYRTCEVMSQHRNSVTLPVRLDDSLCQTLLEDKSTRVMVFCAADLLAPQDIAFPHQSEIKVNGGDVKANLRGLKNKPGSTRPVDITNTLRLRPSFYHNNVEFTYALTQKKFYVVVNLCKIYSVPELTSIISTRRRIPKDSVVSELNKKAQDPDVVATSQVLSLKCPLSYMRLEVPCRSLSCTHIQCFDATSYLQLQEQGPQWLCPICNKAAPFHQLAVDEYVKDILERTSKSLESVIIEPDGQWHVKSAEEKRPSSAGNGLKNEESDDELEISEISFIGSSNRNGSSSMGLNTDTPRPLPNNGTSTPTPRNGSSSVPRPGPANSTPRRLGSTSAKRPAPVVIDLTISSDEDEAPISHRAKRTRAVLPDDDEELSPSQPAAKRPYMGQPAYASGMGIYDDSQYL